MPHHFLDILEKEITCEDVISLHLLGILWSLKEPARLWKYPTRRNMQLQKNRSLMRSHVFLKGDVYIYIDAWSLRMGLMTFGYFGHLWVFWDSIWSFLGFERS